MTDISTIYSTQNKELAKELRRQANRVISDERTHREHPSMINKTLGRDHLSRLNGAVELVNVVFLGRLDDTGIWATVQQARDAAATWLP